MIDRARLIEELMECKELGRKSCMAVAKLINRQPEINQWIPCSEHLPTETGKEYIIQTKNNQIKIARYDYNTTCEFKEFWIDHMKVKDVIAWQPLPKLYKPQNEGQDYE